ncbi:hypothetical protein RJ639_010212 [Escallonia herrerae]|uniref:Uncharacterized protein n=1 Tax=Escallonia herrerae TaxID=1293975 RepID=A0AA88VP41_9ASTE|nr:hypothetical protein RJ639_010212 [Escallonia herrerae]
MLSYERRAPVVVGGSGIRTDWLGRLGGAGGAGAGFSHESEHDLAAMVSDFLESGGGAAETWYSSDGYDSGFSDLADDILVYKCSVDQYESDLLSVVHSLILSMSETNCQLGNLEICNTSCVRFSLVKLLQSSGYNAAVCSAKWQSFGKLPGGEHEFIDVINHRGKGCPERYIIDIDFRSHFEIARAVKPYNLLLNSLPAIYVGSDIKLKQILRTMVEAAKFSLKQNSMPLPPWRSVAYLEAKWDCTSQRGSGLYEKSSDQTWSPSHQHCIGLLKRLKFSIQTDIQESRKHRIVCGIGVGSNLFESV